MMPSPFESLAGNYGLIAVDLPWAFKTWSDKGLAKSAQAHYRCMSLDDLRALPIKNLAARDCWLKMWAINPMIPEAISIMEGWGFKYVTKREWVKRGATGNLAFGTGYVVRGCSEPVLIGKIGTPAICWKGMRGVFEAPRREHSRKPDQFYADCERFAGDVRKVDLFAREKRPGWDVWGNEVEKFGGADVAAA